MSLVQALTKSIAAGGIDADGANLVLKAPLEEVNELALVVVTAPPRPRDLFEAYDPEFQEHPLRVQLRGLPEPVREKIRAAANQRIQAATPVPSATSISELRALAQLREQARNAVVGLSGSGAIDWESLKREAAQIVEMAKVAQPKATLDPNAAEAFRRCILDLNHGPHRITEVNLELLQTFLRLSASDAIGFRVLEAQVSTDRWPTPSLYIDMVRATHGRNANELELIEGAPAAIGRGNPQVVAALFLGALRLAQAQGLPALTLRAGGPTVARLYERMGFETVEHQDMILDLSKPSSVATFLLGFYPSRWGQAPIAADISAQRAAAGDWLTLPAEVSPQT